MTKTKVTACGKTRDAFDVYVVGGTTYCVPVCETCERIARHAEEAARAAGIGSVAREAAELVEGARRAAYGSPSKLHDGIAKLWGAYLGCTVSAKDVALMMVLLKVARYEQAGGRDSLVDIAGYAEVAHLIEQGK